MCLQLDKHTLRIGIFIVLAFRRSTQPAVEINKHINKTVQGIACPLVHCNFLGDTNCTKKIPERVSELPPRKNEPEDALLAERLPDGRPPREM